MAGEIYSSVPSPFHPRAGTRVLGGVLVDRMPAATVKMWHHIYIFQEKVFRFDIYHVFYIS